MQLGASAELCPCRGSGCRNLALPGVYEQAASTLFPALYPTSLLLNLTHTSTSCAPWAVLLAVHGPPLVDIPHEHEWN
jgi:hypothetical protein